ncbi:uromodulin isoform X1 [Dermacentor silvarum]|uniref:uromodulin isoform X1 n=1 Tax=Dermacentor silvarum TaxID=543639 RepID=UPI00189B4976|nr:uromodulin isoform X1 [Dermacentor silvarum]
MAYGGYSGRRYTGYDDSYTPRKKGRKEIGAFIAVFLMCATFCGLLIALLMFLFHNMVREEHIQNMRCAKPILVKLTTGIRWTKTMMVSNDNGSCDNELQQAWYRFETPYGNRMPESPTSPGMCNTMVPFWFYGRHPSYPSMPMPAVACGADETNACSYHANIRVQHCGTYMAYYLQPLPRCFMAYCIGERGWRKKRGNGSNYLMHWNLTTEMSTGDDT